jgi:hypothetical protein
MSAVSVGASPANDCAASRARTKVAATNAARNFSPTQPVDQLRASVNHLFDPWRWPKPEPPLNRQVALRLVKSDPGVLEWRLTVTPNPMPHTAEQENT